MGNLSIVLGLSCRLFSDPLTVDSLSTYQFHEIPAFLGLSLLVSQTLSTLLLDGLQAHFCYHARQFKEADWFPCVALFDECLLMQSLSRPFSLKCLVVVLLESDTVFFQLLTEHPGVHQFLYFKVQQRLGAVVLSDDSVLLMLSCEFHVDAFNH